MKINTKKFLVIFILIVLYIILNFVWSNKVFAVNQSTTTDLNSIDLNKYPQIKELLEELKTKHPNWNFKILYTELDWNIVIANEYVGHGNSPRNLVPANNSRYDGEWVCKACGSDKVYDSGKWHCASEAAIAYMMDPRNSLNYEDIFQFMELTYSECNIDTIKTMVANTFLNNDLYINAIIEAAQKYNVNAYYIVARILQEQGASGSTLSSGKGYNGQYVGVYNVFNIGASGNGKENVILNGLKKAQSKGWTTLESSIIGGTEIIAQSYIAKGQNTLYLQKFDVDNSDGNLYWHQYMQNILAAQSEGETLRETFESVGSVESGYTFLIPVYTNMPAVACERPSINEQEIPSVTDLVRINVTNSLRLRNAPNGLNTVGWVYKDEVVTRLVQGSEKVGGTYWDYVMKADGTKGYAARETYDDETTYKLYLVPIEPVNPPETEQPENPEEDKTEDSGSTTIIKNDKIKVDTESNKITTIPNATVKDLKNLMGESVVVKNAIGEIVADDSKLATGCIVNDTYILSVLGDVNGDGTITAGDYVNIKNHIMGNVIIHEKNELGADVNQDGKITAGDYVTVKNYIMGSSTIEI